MKTVFKKLAIILMIGCVFVNQANANEQFKIQNFKTVKSYRYDGFNDEKKSVGSHAVEGFFIGATAGFVLGGLWGMSVFESNTAFLPIGAMGAGVCGLVGLGIGALMPRYNNIQITPTINPTSAGVDAGLNVGFKF